MSKETMVLTLICDECKQKPARHYICQYKQWKYICDECKQKKLTMLKS